MRELPTPIRDLILLVTVDTRSPAYLLIDNDQRLSDWGGEVEAYGLAELQKGVDVAEQVSLITGLLPLDNTVFLPFVNTD
ncbi:MAG: hypothetical protein M3Q76_12785, partial [Acidobacteriota bacterium]|nr:hypothetical protein [Acidobacteriota bacterium]